MAITPNFGIRYPTDSDLVDIVGDLDNLATDVDTVLNTQVLKLSGGTLVGTLNGTTVSLSANLTVSGTTTLGSNTSIGSVSSTELGYLDGVTSAIQTQFGAKANLAGPTFTGTVTLPSTTSIGNVSDIELGYLDGVTSAIQTQLGTKSPLASPTFTGTVTLPTLVGSDTTDASSSVTGAFKTAGGMGIAKKLYVGTDLTVSGTTSLSANTSIGNVTSTEIGYLDNVTSAIQTQLNAKAADSDVVKLTGNQNVAGIKTFTDTTDASSSTAGGTVLSGGLAVAKKLYVGTNVNAGGTLDVTGQTNLAGNLLITKDTGLIRVNSTSGLAALYLDRLAENNASILMRTGTSNRWAIMTDSNPESGSNAGSDFVIGHYTDAGAWINAAVSIVRSTGAVTLVGTLAASGLAGSLLSSTNPVINGTAAPGTSTIPSRQDHVHPTDTTRAADSAVVKLTGTQSISGGKSFDSVLTVSTAYAGSPSVVFANTDDSTFTGALASLRADRSSNSAFTFLLTQADYNGTPDPKHRLRGDGAMLIDAASYSTGGADYAEYFEWADGNIDGEDRRGYSVSLVGNKIKVAEKGDIVIGVVSANPTVVGDSAWNGWCNKYQKDEWGAYKLTVDGDKIINPIYDSREEYVPREERKEWDAVGLVGKMWVAIDQEVDPRWILLESGKDQQRWLVR